jgi:ankyrin repeat protein
MKTMRKLIFSQVILLLFVLSVFPQAKQTLDEQIVSAVNRDLPQWRAQNPSTPFDFAMATYSAVIKSRWVSGITKADLEIYLSKSIEEIDDHFRMFMMREVTPPNREILDLGKRAMLVETASRVEITFVKANVIVVLETNFPDTRPDKKLPDCYATAPKEEVENALEFARVVAFAIDDEKTFSSCFNNFYRQRFPTATTLEEQLRAAVQKGETESVKSLIAKNANVNHVFPGGETALHLAVRQGCAQTVKRLIDARADVNAKDAKGFAPLMIATGYGDLELVKYLISAGADVQARDVYGRNAGFFVISNAQGLRPGFPPASIEDKTAVIKYLAARGLNLNEKDTLNNNTPLIALLHDCLGSAEGKALVNLFLDLGVDVNAENKYGETALIDSVHRINGTVRNEFVNLLLARGANPNHKDKNNLSALGYALKDRKLYENDKGYSKHIAETIRLLKDAGAIE